MLALCIMYVYVWVYVCIYIYVCLYICMYVCMCTGMYINETQNKQNISQLIHRSEQKEDVGDICVVCGNSGSVNVTPGILSSHTHLNNIGEACRDFLTT